MGKTNRKNILKIVAVNLILFAFLIGLILINKERLRPEFSHIAFMSILTGSLPNFIAALLISLFFVTAVLIKKASKWPFYCLWMVSVSIYNIDY